MEEDDEEEDANVLEPQLDILHAHVSSLTLDDDSNEKELIVDADRPILDEEGNEVIFNPPLDFGEYDRYTLSNVLKKYQENTKDDSRNAHKSQQLSRSRGQRQLRDISNIDNELNTIEDMDDMRRMKSFVQTDNEKVDVRAANKPTPIKSPDHFEWAISTILPSSEYEKLKARGLALQFPFELDTFQQQAVMRLERNENVFVTAHTSAGKTVVAEYAIQMALNRTTRAIYTSPIKALSNQKYRDFRIKFGAENVGIITGDVSVNPNASCLIMTTEIFRSMLYKGSDTVRDIEFVIFDEVHYVNDAERGVVWEEVIIMLPAHIKLIFLSATTPNAKEFSEWIGRTKRKKVYLMGTQKRPVPLQHYLYHGEEVYPLLVGGKFNDKAIHDAERREKEKSAPKPKTAENAKFSNDRQSEKLAVASRNAGRTIAPGQGRGRGGGGRGGGGREGRGGAAGGAGGRGGSSNVGGKAEWLGLMNILACGGREAAGGLRQVDFGPDVKRKNILSAKAREQKLQKTPYDKLPADLRKGMTKKEYESIEFRDDDEEGDEEDGGLLPVVVFSFSKKQCEANAEFFGGKDLLTKREKGKVGKMLQQVHQHISPGDAELPQFVRLTDMLSRGIGVHHGGLLPILKETVEMLFAESIVKVLFATETFAMGVNMPARSVVFNGFRKHDGRTFRDLLPGEYIQEAGRAGRRGLDKVGTVVICAWGKLPEPAQLRTLLTGSATKLSSQFRLRYNMMLSLIRAGSLTVEDMMKRSFTEFHTQRELGKQDFGGKIGDYSQLLDFLRMQQKEMRTKRISERGEEQEQEGELVVEDLLQWFEQSLYVLHSLLGAVPSEVRSRVYPQLFAAGRLLCVQTDQVGGPCLAIIIRSPYESELYETASSKTVESRSDADIMREERLKLSSSQSVRVQPQQHSLEDMHIWLLIFLPPTDSNADFHAVTAALVDDGIDFSEYFQDRQRCLDISSGRVVEEAADGGGYRFCRVAVSKIALLFNRVEPFLHHYRHTNPNPAFHDPSNLPHVLSIPSLLSFLEQAFCHIRDGGTGILPLNPTDGHERRDVAASELKMAFEECKARFNPFQRQQSIPDFAARFGILKKIWRVENKVKVLSFYKSDNNMSLFPDFQQRLKLLGSLGYVEDDNRVVTLKGRTACELNTCDELLATEILFANVLEPLNPPEAAAMLSALVFQEKNDIEDALTSRMETARRDMRTIFEQLNLLQQLEKIELDEDAKPILNFGLCAVVYQWARGMSFKDVMSTTEFQEGSIVRCITRLDELCKDVQKAAVVIGNQSLYRKMEAASLCIRRDIVFAASLYLM